MTNKSILLLFLTLSALVHEHTVFADEKTLCSPDETIILSCPVQSKKQKIISMCGKRIIGNNNLDYIEYRFGTTKKVEMTYRVTNDNGLKIYRGLDKGTYSVYFGFQVYDYFYLIDVMQEIPGARMSLTITKKSTGKDVATILCKENNWTEDKNIKTNLLTEVDGRALIDGEINPPE
jgi:hypothetical protein